MSDATQKCPACGAVLPARAKFCAECGATLRAQTASTVGAVQAAGNQVLPWFIAGVCVLAVHATVIILAVRRPEPAAGNQSNVAAPFANGGSGATGRAPDISSLTPREAADRLYNRISQASEAGDSGQVSFFAPMALQAYAAVRPLDIDARLHVGMIELATGNAAGAAAQADTIQRQSRTHLFGTFLKARAAEAKGNTVALRAAYQQLLANWTSEMAKGLPEYTDHKSALDELHAAAQRR